MEIKNNCKPVFAQASRKIATVNGFWFLLGPIRFGRCTALSLIIALHTLTAAPFSRRPLSRSARAGEGASDSGGDSVLGEGKLVRIAAFINEAHYADLCAGESVNCNLATEKGNNIHIALGPTATTLECSNMTAEISPHSGRHAEQYQPFSGIRQYQ